MNNKEISAKLWTILKPAGFARRASTFQKLSDEAILIVNVQRSFGESFYFNLGIYLRRLVDSDPWSLKYHAGHLVARLERLLPRYREEIGRFASRETEPRSLQRDRLVPGYRELIPNLTFGNPDGAPWDPMRDLEVIFASLEFRELCDECLSEAGLKRLYARSAFPVSLVPKRVQALLSA